MEEIKNIIQQRIDNLQQIQNQFPQPPTDNPAPEPQPQQQQNTQTKQQIYKSLNNLKKQEKVREIKENELVDALFNFKQASVQQRKQYQQISLQIMAKIDSKFKDQYQNYLQNI